MRTKQQIQAEIDSLKNEQKELRDWLDTIADEIKVKRRRFFEIVGDCGEIKDKKREIRDMEREIRDMEYPVFTEDIAWGNAKIKTRIVALSDKWITLRQDGSDEIKEYSVTTGFKKHSKSSWSKIDHEKALTIWAQHQAGK